MSQALLTLLQSQFGASVLETHSQFGDDTAVIEASQWLRVAQFLFADARASMDQFIDLTAVDYPTRAQRFEVVLHLRSMKHGHRLRLKARVADSERVEMASVVSVWAGANWFEREAFDMFGVHFTGHPDLRRILMYPEFEGYPLRKDYPADKIQPLVEFREVPGKQFPFRDDEGMSFGRVTHDAQHQRHINPDWRS
jgi:NADH-quinone oxidoreductase subunit C